MYLVILLLACGDEGGKDPADAPDDSGAPGAEGEDAPYLSDEIPLETPAFDAAQTAAALEEVLANARRIHAGPVLETYVDLLEQGDGSCPQWTTYEDGTPLWYDACTASSGVQFDGYGLLYEYAGMADGDGNTWRGYQAYSVATITDESGNVFSANGSAGILEGTSLDGADLFYTYLDSGYAWDGPGAEGTWLEWGLSPSIYWWAASYAGIGKLVALSGMLEVEDGPVAAVILEDLYLVEADLGGTCGAEPSGSISILDSEGNWYDLSFDGPSPDGGEVDADLCDGCGTAWYRGERLGEACVDFSVLTDWEEKPWE